MHDFITSFLLLDYNGREHWTAGCVFCHWVEDYKDDDAALSGYIRHDCDRKLPQRPTVALQAWYERAGCRGEDVDTFYDMRHVQRALEMCRACPVTSSCLYDALDQERSSVPWGIRGGLLPHERTAVAHGES